jgi:Uncharacterized conserved protein
MKEQFLSYFHDATIVRIIDIVLVLIIIIQLYRAFKRSVAFNIFIVAVIIYVLWVIVHKLDMPLMSEILNRMVSIGLIGLIVVFQPEIRKFLIIVGKRTPFGNNGFVSRLFQSNTLNKYIVEEEVIDEICQALRSLREKKLGAILVIARSDRFEFDTNTGKLINGLVSAKLIESIFAKTSPLHDGAVLIDKNNLIAAGVVLPISHRNDLPQHVGLRHRSGLGATENSDVMCVILSEETQEFSIASEGKLLMDIPLEDVKKEMYQAMIG